jgi:chromosomal replication initiator protein
MDCHPRLAEELMPELVDRLLGGAVWGLLPPDDETRLGILRAKSGGGNLLLPDDVLKYLARNLRGNVRELEGAVNGVRHFARVTGRPVNQSLVREALGDLLRHTVRAVTVADVDAAVCVVLRLAAGTLQSKARSWAVSHPRMVAIFLARKHTAATYGEISKHFGAKTHSTAVAAEKKVRGWLQKDEKLSLGDREWRAKDLLERVERELQR